MGEHTSKPEVGTLTLQKRWSCFGGEQRVYALQSASTGTETTLGVFLPPAALGPDARPVPALYWLSGLTCTWENATTKAGFQRVAAELGLAVITPDTSPRGTDAAGNAVPDAPGYDFGQGAGFYLDATAEPWAAHFRMAQLIVHELPARLEAELPLDPARRGVSGHSMGGHGALVLALKNPGHFRSVSAFSPICAPSQVPWGQKALAGYLGDDAATWAEHDACALLQSREFAGDLLVDQGEADEFLAGQLRPDLLEAACAQAQVPLTLRLQPGYDHSYWFVATFMEDHLRWHGARLG
jgi:S-formylglutathione hydrolase